MDIIVNIHEVAIIIETLPRLHYRHRIFIDGGMLCNGDECRYTKTLEEAFEVVRKEVETIAEEFENSYTRGCRAS